MSQDAISTLTAVEERLRTERAEAAAAAKEALAQAKAQGERLVADALARAEAEADFTVIFAHWGVEYQTNPNRFQTELADLLLASVVMSY